MHVKVTNAKALAEFRNKNDIKRVPTYHRKLNGHEMFLLRDAHTADRAFGRRNRPSTPIKGVVNNEFAFEAKETVVVAKSVARPKNNRATQLATERVKE